MSDIDWTVIDKYFENYRYYISQHHLDSYNSFVTKSIPYIISKLNSQLSTIKIDETTDKIRHKIDVLMGVSIDNEGNKTDNKIYLSKPFLVDSSNTDVTKETNNTRVLFPNEARLKDLNYLSELSVDISVIYTYPEIDGKRDVKYKTFEKIKIGSIPIMLHSNICILNNQNPEVLKEMGECPFDHGGYFIIAGKEKILISQERITTNRLFITDSNDTQEHYSLEGLIRCTSEENTLFPKTVKFGVFTEKYLRQCKSLETTKDDQGKTQRNRGCRKEAIIVTCPNIDLQVPIFMMFRALGIESDQKILEYIVGGDIFDEKNSDIVNFLRSSLIDSNLFYSQSECLEYMGDYTKYRNVDYVRYVLTEDFLPNVGRNFNNKALFLGYLINKIVKTHLGLLEKTNRDNYIHKRIDLSGVLLTNLFRDFYNQLRNNIKNRVDSIYNYESYATNGDIKNLINASNIGSIFNPDFLENGIIRSLKGQWGIDMKPENAGIVQDLDRLSHLGYISHVRRVNTPIERTTKLTEPHRLSTSQYGYICPVESPDGANIGLLKNLSILCLVSSESKKTEILKILSEKIFNFTLIDYLYPVNINNRSKILINNTWYGVSDKPNVIVENLKEYRKNGKINNDISISWNIKENEINILCDAGRCIRPLYIVEDDNKLTIDKNLQKLTNNFSWKDLVANNNKSKASIEFIDVEETNTRMIAMNRTYLGSQKASKNNSYWEPSVQPYTNCEIHPSSALSIYTNTIPFPNRNQAPRNVFSGQQGKQALGVYATNFNSRIDTASYILHYPQKALVRTRYAPFSHSLQLPNGENLIVAIMTYTGYNQEDSIILNRNAIDRGMFNVTSFKSIVEEENTNEVAGEKIIFANPVVMAKNGLNIDRKYANWNTIDEDGYPIENTLIKEDDVIVGKVNTTQFEEENNADIFASKVKNNIYTDKSVVGSKTIYGTVDKVYIYKKLDGMKKVKIRMRKFRIPTLGDKMASRNGQKGVCGMIYNQEDMPYTKNGLIPDMIINPHAIPSRMTIAHLVESVLSKLCCLTGTTINATAFENHNIDDYYESLNKLGYNKYGNELMYNGFTGEQINSEIFIGPTYYYRLKHMVQDKINYRTSGPKTAITKQPVKGRASGGGLRIGEMETNVLLAHGFSSFIKETMMERSDGASYDINSSTGNLAYLNKNLNTLKSTDDEEAKEFSRITMPVSFKILMQELEAFAIAAKLKINPSNENETFYEDGTGDDDDYVDDNESDGNETDT